jgi:hypothetical protein
LERRLEAISEIRDVCIRLPRHSGNKTDASSKAESRRRGCITCSESKFEEGRGLAAWSDDSRQYPKFEMLVLDCLATAETRQRLHPQLNQEEELHNIL